jgi:hypothetical protein
MTELNFLKAENVWWIKQQFSLRKIMGPPLHRESCGCDSINREINKSYKLKEQKEAR